MVAERSVSRDELEFYLSSLQRPSAWKKAQVAAKPHDRRKGATVPVDGNGNITALVNGATGAIAAAYEYDPFGQPLRTDMQDSTVADQPFRFSTKFTDLETGLVYYGHRFYAPNLGRFVSRDPVEEAGGINLYAFCGNDGINKWDVLGNAPGDYYYTNNYNGNTGQYAVIGSINSSWVSIGSGIYGDPTTGMEVYTGNSLVDAQNANDATYQGSNPGDFSSESTVGQWEASVNAQIAQMDAQQAQAEANSSNQPVPDSDGTGGTPSGAATTASNATTGSAGAILDSSVNPSASGAPATAQAQVANGSTSTSNSSGNFLTIIGGTVVALVQNAGNAVGAAVEGAGSLLATVGTAAVGAAEAVVVLAFAPTSTGNDQPPPFITLYHYTQPTSVASIQANGLWPGSWATDNPNYTPIQAQQLLALPNPTPPTVMIPITVFSGGYIGPTPVLPANGQPGGGTQYNLPNGTSPMQIGAPVYIGP